ncbi:hypothetical protein CEXT_567711 [Caerostris extrusa]|uniref:Secreted protein n=1 Tax=Caerostris extrusa TaxID=172846 RepID=A0AAV4R0M9_CAEEX|nr:hypothetical protein CEXT_567711 [Caerostris extrusa]
MQFWRLGLLPVILRRGNHFLVSTCFPPLHARQAENTPCGENKGSSKTDGQSITCSSTSLMCFPLFLHGPFFFLLFFSLPFVWVRPCPVDAVRKVVLRPFRFPPTSIKPSAKFVTLKGSSSILNNRKYRFSGQLR